METLGTLSDAVTATTQRLRVAELPASNDRRKAEFDLSRVLGRRYAPEAVRLDSMAEYSPGIANAKAKIRAVIANIVTLTGDGKNVILYGTVGTGKDRMLAAMLYAVVESGATAHWMNGLEIYGRFRDAMDAGRRESELLRDLAKPDVLGISDPTPPFGNATDWNVATLYRVIDLRYRRGLCTWLTLNCKNEDDAREQLSDRVFDRLVDGAIMVPCFWPSWREKNRG